MRCQTTERLSSNQACEFKHAYFDPPTSGSAGWQRLKKTANDQMRKSELVPCAYSDARQRMNRDSNYPRFLYKYRRATAQHLEPLLLESTFYLSSREQFNDPFDASCIVTVNGDWRKRAERLSAMKRNARAGGAKMNLGIRHRLELHRDMLDPERAQARIQRAYDKNASEYGIYSMGETPRSLLMWAHYAESHTGVCLGFYVPADPEVFAHALPVRYSEDYPTVEWTEFDKANAIQTLLTKSKEWEYEQESRILLAHSAFHKLAVAQASLASVIFGARCSRDSERLVMQLLKRRVTAGHPMPVLMRAHLAPQKYSIGIFSLDRRPSVAWKGRPASIRPRRQYDAVHGEEPLEGDSGEGRT